MGLKVVLLPSGDPDGPVIILPQAQNRFLKTYFSNKREKMYFWGINVHEMFKSLFLKQQSILRTTHLASNV